MAPGARRRAEAVRAVSWLAVDACGTSLRGDTRMQLRSAIRLAAFVTILAPTTAAAQLETLPHVELPAVGAWATYQLTRRNESQRIVTQQTVSLLARDTVAGEEFWWFQIEMESDDYGTERVPVVTQVALSREDALGRADYLRKARDMIVKVGTAPAYRIPA